MHPSDRCFAPGRGKRSGFLYRDAVIESATSVVLPTQADRPRAWERDNKMKKEREGKKQDGKFYLRVGKTWVEVNKEVYYGYMDLVWQEEKNEDRRSRCMIGGKRCEGNCEACKHDRTGSPLSLDQMYEEDDYEASDKQVSVEDQVLSRFLHEALHKELDALPLEDQVLLHDIYFEDIPYTQRQIARKLHISQQAVSKRHLALLADLRVKLEAEICD